MKKIVSQIWIGLICIILGFMITFQFKANSSTQIKSSSRKYGDMAKEVESLKKQKDDLNLKVKEYQDKVDEYEKVAADDSVYVKNMKDELDKLRILAGVTDREGPGIEITVSLPLDMTRAQSNIINYQYILEIVNELNSLNEAQAISINDERYTSRTQIRQVGNVIKINDGVIDPTQPIIIKAIGRPEVLLGAFSIPDNILQYISEQGLEVKRIKLDNIKILKYSKNIENKYIK